MYYHGSAVRGLGTLLPVADLNSNLPYPCVYLSSGRALAGIRIWARRVRWMILGITPRYPGG